MPRKKQSIEAYGKLWSPIDLPNLEKAIKLYERLNYLQDHFANSLSGSQAIMKQINEQTDIQNELQQLGIKLTEDQIKVVVSLIKKRQEENKELDKSNNLKGSTYGALTGNTIQNKYGKTPKGYDRPNTSIYQQRSLQGFLNNAGGIYTTSRQNRVYNQAIEIETNKIKDSGSIMSDDSIRKVAELNIKNGRMSSETSELFNKSAKSFNKGAGIVQIAADTFMSAVKTFGGMFTEGKNKQVNTYEDTFTGIAARTGYSRSEYYTQQAQTNNELGDLGLRDNIRTSEVQQMWSTLTSEGLSIEDSIANAFDTVISSKVVPYLNTSTAQFQFLVDQQPNLMTQVRGIGRTTMEISGSATFATKYLQDMIDTIAPMASLAENELGLQFAQVSGAYESLRAQGLNDAQIGEMYKASASVYNNPYQALKSGSLDEKMAVANVIQTGGDLRDFSDVNASMMTSQNFVANLVPEGNLGPLYSGMLVSGNKLSGTTALGVALNEGNYDMEQAISDGIKASNMVDDMGNKVTEEFRNGDYQTNKERQAITMENLSNELATMQQFMGGWYDVIVTAIKGVAGMIAATVVGKGIGALAGSAGGGTGTGLLAAVGANGLAIGSFAAAAGIVLTGIISDGIVQGYADNLGKNSDYYENTGQFDKFIKTDANGNEIPLSEGAKNLLSTGIDTEGNKGWGSNIALGLDFINEYKTNNLMGWGVSRKDRNQASWEYTIGALRGENLENDGKDFAKAALAWLMIADASGVISDIDGWSSSDIKDAFKSIYDSDEDAANWVKKITEWGQFKNPQMSTDFGKNMEYKVPTNFDNYHRQGLDYVPEDNYPALLHQGEAVLTASTANELRTLVDEYRNTNKESISFETIIQNQTSSLISKMDEMLQVIRSFTGTTTTDWRNGFITNSMKYVKSTKSFS